MSIASFRISTRPPTKVFVTAFYGVYDPARRTLTYSSAGHNPPRLKRCGDGSVNSLEEIGGPPLGLFDELQYEQTTLAAGARRHPRVLHGWNYGSHERRRAFSSV